MHTDKPKDKCRQTDQQTMHDSADKETNQIKTHVSRSEQWHCRQANIDKTKQQDENMRVP